MSKEGIGGHLRGPVPAGVAPAAVMATVRGGVARQATRSRGLCGGIHGGAAPSESGQRRRPAPRGAGL